MKNPCGNKGVLHQIKINESNENGGFQVLRCFPELQMIINQKTRTASSKKNIDFGILSMHCF